MDNQNEFISRVIKTEKVFQLPLGECFYANLQSNRKIEKSDQDYQIKITNRLCKQTGECLLKTTQISFGSRVFIIEDSYRFTCKDIPTLKQTPVNLLANNTSTEASLNNRSTTEGSRPQGSLRLRKKKLIFKNKLSNSQSQNFENKRNTKNIAKNFLKAFVSYLEESRDKAVLEKTKILIDEVKYNNRAIQKITKDQEINQTFMKFLSTKAEQWISLSKVQDKKSHLQAISLYLDLIREKKSLSSHGRDSSKYEYRSIYDSDSGSSEQNQFMNLQNSQR